MSKGKQDRRVNEWGVMGQRTNTEHRKFFDTAEETRPHPLLIPSKWAFLGRPGSATHTVHIRQTRTP